MYHPRYPLDVAAVKPAFKLATEEEVITLTGLPSFTVFDAFCRLAQAGRAGQGPAEAAARADSDLAVGRQLQSEQLFFEAPPDFVTGRQMAAMLSHLYGLWNERMFSGPLWQGLADGTAPRSVMIGWLVESYHFIRGANARLPYAAAHCSDERIRSIIVHHHVEEYDHHVFFAESLTRAGVSVETVDALGPLPTTAAVMNMARAAARIDELAYVACSGLLESTGSDAGRARGFYQKVAAHYDGEGTGFVDPMIKHIDLDEAYEHGSVMKDVFEPIAVIATDRADTILRTAFSFMQTLTWWFRDIQQFYSASPFRNGQHIRHHRSAAGK